MENVYELISQLLSQQTLIEAVFSNVRNKSLEYSKVKVKPVLLKNEWKYQFTYYVGTKVIHENLSVDSAKEKMHRFLEDDFKQGVFFTPEADYQVLVSKKKKATILKQKPTKKIVDASHNRKKSYILEEGTAVPYLVELGVMNKEGKVLSKKYDKFKQINRFLELIDDIVPYLPKDRTLRIVDFGCGKSYLTFALYHYLKEMLQLDIEVTGLDLKADVIENCNRLAKEFQYDKLQFLVGDIERFSGVDQVDLVVTLHACDTATDAALEKAVRWNAEVILSVPCCQHELYDQVQNPILAPMLNHGIIRERFAALATDSVRAQILEIVGYKTQIVEFIDMEHTPKNLMIRAIKQKQTTEQRNKKMKQYEDFKQFLHIDPYLERALKDHLKLESI